VKAKPLLHERHIVAEDAFVELVVWQVPSPVVGSSHAFKYRLALVANGVCMLRYDNEAGKGDHKHIGELETRYAFQNLELLLAEFWKDVDNWRA
jgi:hypothetical protein